MDTIDEQSTRLLTLDGLARKLDVGHQKVRELVRKDVIPCIRIGKAIRFDWNEVVAALRAAEQSGADS